MYENPGIRVEAEDTPVLSPSTVVPPVLVALVGKTANRRSYTEVVQLENEDEVRLSRLGIDLDLITVENRFTGEAYSVGDDFDITQEEDDDGYYETYISRIEEGEIPDGEFVTVSYEYRDPDFLEPRRVADYDDIRDAYGRPFDDEGEIYSELSLAARLFFQNGPSEVYAVPVDDKEGDADQLDAWEDALDRLADIEDVDVVVPISGNEAVHDKVELHVNSASNNRNRHRRAILGRDGTTGAVSRDDLVQKANVYSNQRLSLIDPTKFKILNDRTDEDMNVGAQYAAAAIAGRMASQDVQEPLTRKSISGFRKVGESRTESDMLSSQRNGLMVVWQKRNGQIIVRHGLTTDTTNIFNQELSVMMGRDRLTNLFENMLDQQGLIGSPITENTPETVVGGVTGVLEEAVEDGLIYSYDGVKFRIPSSRPTVIQVKFQYQPTMPLNYVEVSFAIDTQSGTLEFDDGELTA